MIHLCGYTRWRWIHWRICTTWCMTVYSSICTWPARVWIFQIGCEFLSFIFQSLFVHLYQRFLRQVFFNILLSQLQVNIIIWTAVAFIWFDLCYWYVFLTRLILCWCFNRRAWVIVIYNSPSVSGIKTLLLCHRQVGTDKYYTHFGVGISLYGSTSTLACAATLYGIIMLSMSYDVRLRLWSEDILKYWEP